MPPAASAGPIIFVPSNERVISPRWSWEGGRGLGFTLEGSERIDVKGTVVRRERREMVRVVGVGQVRPWRVVGVGKRVKERKEVVEGGARKGMLMRTFHCSGMVFRF